MTKKLKTFKAELLSKEGVREAYEELAPDYEAVRAAKKVREKRFHFSRHMCWGEVRWPCKWGFFTDWTSFTLDVGEPKVKFHGVQVPEPEFTLTISIWPPGISCFWGHKQLLWVGDLT